MPVYLFTYHAYGTWMPDREEAYVDRRGGILSADYEMAQSYRISMLEDEKQFTADHQRKLIDIIVDSQQPQRFQCFGIATESTHIHALIAWDDDRDPIRMRASVKSSLSRGMNKEFGKQEWLSEGASRKRVRNRTHFDYLLEHYLAKHRGLVWNRWHSGPCEGPSNESHVARSNGAA